MSGYTDMFVVPVPRARIADYRALAETAAAAWRDAGALSYTEHEAEDVMPGKLTSFPQAVALAPDETIFVAIITYRSRAHRDEVNERAMKDSRMASFDPKSMPFDTRRMFWGGFKPFIQAN